MRLSGPWSAEQIHAFLETSIIPVRLGVITANDGPLVLSLWFLQQDNALWCATPRNALVSDLLRRNPACAFEVAADLPPYKGVRGQAKATLHDDRGGEILALLLQRYGIATESKLGQMLTKRAPTETAVCIRAHKMTSWDFTARMTS